MLPERITELNWRRGFRRIATLYLMGSALALVVSFAFDAREISCPRSYVVSGKDRQRQEIFLAQLDRRQALQGKCDLLTGTNLARRRASDRAAEALGLEPERGRLPVCPANALEIEPVPLHPDETVIVPIDERVECFVGSSQWHRFPTVLAWVLAVPVALALIGSLLALLLKIGTWVAVGFRRED